MFTMIKMLQMVCSGDLGFAKGFEGRSQNPSMQAFFPYFRLEEAYLLTHLWRGLASLINFQRQYGSNNKANKNTRTKFPDRARGYNGLGQITSDDRVRKRLELDAHF